MIDPTDLLHPFSSTTFENFTGVSNLLSEVIKLRFSSMQSYAPNAAIF
jgi:hypothetical protein